MTRTNKPKNPAARSSKLGLSIKTTNNSDDISLPAQRQRLLEWLHKQPITTIEARHSLNTLAPAARIFELRHRYGYNIMTRMIKGKTIEGKVHSVAQYSLISGKWNNKKQLGGN